MGSKTNCILLLLRTEGGLHCHILFLSVIFRQLAVCLMLSTREN